MAAAAWYPDGTHMYDISRGTMLCTYFFARLRQDTQRWTHAGIIRENTKGCALATAPTPRTEPQTHTARSPYFHRVRLLRLHLRILRLHPWSNHPRHVHAQPSSVHQQHHAISPLPGRTAVACTPAAKGATKHRALARRGAPHTLGSFHVTASLPPAPRHAPRHS